MPPSPSQLVTLRAVLDRLIPADDFPGALGAGTENYVLRYLAADGAAEAAGIFSGLDQLDLEATARHGAGTAFNALTAAQQEALLSDLEHNRTRTPWPASTRARAFLNRLVDLAHEGFYADPANGGNRSAASWAMIGYETRLPPLTLGSAVAQTRPPRLVP